DLRRAVDRLAAHALRPRLGVGHLAGRVRWPRLGPLEQIIWNQEIARRGLGLSMFMPGLCMAGPTIIAHGSEAQRELHLGPLLRGDEPPASGYVAAAQSPWPGPIAVYRSPEDSGFQLKAMVLAPAVTGVTLDPLPSGATSRFDRATSIRVRLDRGTLASVTELALLGGANAAAIQNADGAWEVLQFQSAVLSAPATYTLTGFLRGQAGTEHAMQQPVAAGARFVLLDGAHARVDMTEDEIGLAYTWKCGPASRDIGSPHYLDAEHTFTGEGLKPLRPVHVRATRSGGDLSITWIRRTRIGGDSWDGVDVPLGEDEERYEIDILDGSTIVRTLTASSPAATYTAAEQTADFGAPQSSVSLRIYQLSATRGRGTPREAVV
ncbi:MAG: hypothetical protein HC869_24280, partial [Rhodospirillales bacterium]|nr:hypothetical protein [Rhodospirillales bacterium]